MSNVGTAYLQIMPSTKGFAGSLSSAIDGDATSAGKSAGMNIVGAIKGAIATAGIGAFFKKALDFGGELQQNLGGTEAVFGQYAKNVQSLAEDAYKNMGMSASDYMATANKMGSLFQGSGIEQQKSLELTTKAMQRASDVASVMGISQQSAMESIAGAAKGNFTMMDNLGVAMNATTLAAYALEKGVNFDWNTASNAEKAELAMQMFMERTAQYEGNFARESEETFSGSIEAMKAAATNLMANLSLGNDIREPLNALIETTKNFLLNNLFPMIGNILKQLPGIIGEGLKWAFENIPNLVDSAISFLNKLTAGMTENSGVFKEKLVEIGHAALEMFKNIDWKGLGTAVIDFIWTGLQLLGGLIWDGLKAIGQLAVEKMKEVDWKQLGQDVIKFIWEGLGAVGSWIWDKLKLIGAAAVEKMKEIDWVQLGKDVIKFIWNGLGEIGSWIWEKLKLLGDAAVEKFKEIDWLQLGKDVINFIVDGLKEIGETIWEKLKELGDTAVEKFKEIDWVQVGKDVINLLWEGIKSVGGWVVDGISWLAEKGAGLFSGDDAESNVDWYNTGYDVPEDIANGISNNGWRTSNALQSVTTDAWNAANTGYDWFGMGTSIVGGIANGIWYYGSSIYNALYSQVSSAWQNAKLALGIYSPSKVMRDEIGKWIPLGIAEGIESETPAVMDAMAGITKDLTTSIDTGFAYNATLDTGDGGAETAPGGIVINVYPSAGMDERALADMVQSRLALAQRQKQAAWGTA